MNSIKLAVTGITGHSGGFFLEEIEKANFSGTVRALVRIGSDTSRINASHLKIESVIAKLDDDQSLQKAFAGCDTVLHIAHVGFSEAVVKAAVKSGVKWCILVHTTGSFSRFKSASVGYKSIEERLRTTGNNIAITILRPTMIYGTRADRNMFKLIDYLYRHRLFPIFGNGRNLLQPVHARDLGRAYHLVLANQPRTENRDYNLSGGDALPYSRIVEIVAAKLGKRVILVRIPMGLSIILARLYNYFVKSAKISVEQVIRMREDKDFSHEAARCDFGYDPICFTQGIADEVYEYLALKK